MIVRELDPECLKSFRRDGLSRDDAELRDCISALRDAGTPDDSIDRLAGRYLAWQALVREGEVAAPPLPDGLPPELGEFILYVEGVRQMRQVGRREDCPMPDAWRKLLSLPLSERRYRTAWVYYTFGNMNLSVGRKEIAAGQYRRVQQAVKEGAIDTCGLAGAAFGKLFDCASREFDRLKAAVYAAVYDDSDARYYFRRQLAYSEIPEGERSALLDDDLAREALAASMMTHWQPSAFLRDLEGREIRQGERLAFIAYNLGDMDLTARFLSATPDESVLKWWLEGKLCRWRGDLEGAAQALRKWLAIYSDAEPACARVTFTAESCRDRTMTEEVKGLLGTILVEQRDFLEALNTFIEASSWLDAAFVAERLLSIESLKRYVDANCPASLKRGSATSFFSVAFNGSPETLRAELRYLFGRRLARNDRIVSALPYLPAELRPLLAKYHEFLRVGERPDLDRSERAAAYYNAAKLLRHHGMEMVGCELYPDARVWGGSFAEAALPNLIAQSDDNDLLASARESLPSPEYRFHYRYRAADLMDRAAELTSDRDFQAVAYYVGGMWLQGRNPVAADPFYKSLAGIRNQALGRLADEKRWFPRTVSRTLQEEIRDPGSRTFAEVRELGKTALMPRD